MLFDSDVLIFALRGSSAAQQAIDSEHDPAVSVVTCMELLMGARDRQDAREIKVLLNAVPFGIIPLSEDIGHRATIYMEEYGLRSGLDVPDALIAATAMEHGLTLCTGNQKHFRVIADLDLRPFRA